ncbi:vacuolar-sorting protein BRO1 isoform X2 [Selaginella moellendorffii]|uniref:vacuolar-sorting protein BRO1 isoform X2 n=1 Tax=Selaginella moellendorffii TaxID=88036 RepID=UPI000D1CF7DB|nr:vacuolar-sorting protein BRO1 isoform X2 [Selaginella moellendorffii]|eukprot:XP_024535562.1 vacuolar-sorting protein BRO1 isoform X2 [Selaginella moellendorffii]
MAAASINVMLAIHAKKTTPVDLHKPLRLYISQHYSEREAREADDDLQSVQEMRSEIEKATDSLDSRRDLLQRYFRALCVMESRFPISSEREHVNSLSFTWYDAFKQGRKASQQNIHFEKAAIAFNLGAVYSQIALSADRSLPEGLKQACNSFQAAAGAFAFLRDNVSMKASGNSTTTDISVECAGMLERLMLAQAQECFFEKVVSDNRPSALCAKVARQVGLFYDEAHAALVLPPLNQHFDRSWVSHVQLKAAQFQAEACYRVSLELHEKENIAEEIARLKAASSMLTEAKKSGRGVIGPLLDAVTKLDGSVSRNLERAVKENDRVYLMRVPNPDSLPPLPSAVLVKSAAVAELLDASKEKMFSNLVPDSSAKALSKYTEMLDEIIRVQAEKLQQESEITRVKLKEMNLPDSLLALEGNASLPEHLRDDVEAVQIDGGPAGLESEMAQLRDLRRVNEELLVQTEELLEKESREDSQIRAQFGTRWTRPQSSTLTKNLHDRANGFAANLKQSGESDRRIERAIKDNTAFLSILDARPIESALPSLARPILSLNGNEDAVVGALRQKLSELDRLGLQRASLEDMLKDMKRQDNILPKLMTTSGSYEDLFKRELAKYEPVSIEVARNVQAQEQLLHEIEAHNNAFAATFNLQDYVVARERAYKQLSAAIAKYREIRENINEGLKFYVTLQDAITNLKQQCSDYVMTRNIQSREMMEDLQRQITGTWWKSFWSK